MLPAIEKLLVLQDRDRSILKLQDELAHIGPERQDLQSKLAVAQQGVDAARLRVKQLESDRKKLELDADAKRGLIEKYSLQQFQTKKNEEYRALAHEIEVCKEAIAKLEDQQLELMEQAEAAQRQVAAISQTTSEAKKSFDGRIGDLLRREQTLQTELAGLRTNREEIAGAVDETLRSRYDRLLKNKGSSVVVGIQHGVCGGCHMQLSRSIIVLCQAHQEIITCPNCGRILFYTRDMDMLVAD